MKDEFFIKKHHFFYNIELLFDKKFINIDYTTSSTEIMIEIDKKLVETTLGNLEKFFINNNFDNLLSMFNKIFTNLSKNLIIVFEILNKFNKFKVVNENNRLNIQLADVINKVDNNEHDDVNDADLGYIEKMFKIIQSIIKFVNQQLFELDLNFKVTTKTTINEMFKIEFKKHFLNSFFKFIYENLILKSIKLQEFNLKKMLSLCSLIDDFERFLLEIQFVNGIDNGSANSDYENLLFKSFKLNIDNIYINKKCKHLLTKARKIIKIKTDLFETCLISDENEASRVKSVNILNENFKFQNDCQNGFLKFNKCKVSQLTIKLINVVYETLNEAEKFEKINEENCKIDDELNNKLIKNVSLLCLTAKNIIDLYSSIMPVFYKDEYQNLPLMAG